MRTDHPIRLARAALALIVCAALGWIAFGRGARVPLLSGVDFGFHEFGHLLFAWAPEGLAVFAGSATQVGVPLGLAAYFGLARRERLSAAVLLAWAATSLQDASVYIADAPYQALPLWGNGEHDWALLLGPFHWNVLPYAGAVARTVWVFGLLLLLGAVALCVFAIASALAEEGHERAEESRIATLPVREPSTRDAKRPSPGETGE